MTALPRHSPSRRSAAGLTFGLCVSLFFIVAVGAPFVGSHALDLSELAKAWQGTPTPDADIFFFQRIPRVVLGLLVGGTLAMVGAAFQVILRNPLAEPFTLGTTGGASLGAVIAISVPQLWINWGPFSSVQLLALLGGGTTLAFIYLLARRRGGLSMNTLLLTGVTLGIFCASLVLLVRYLVNPNLLVQMDRWMMGGLDVVGYRELASLLPLLVPGLAILGYQATALNHLTLGDEMALGHGIDVRAVQRETFIGAGLATAAVVSLAGPIGFIGMVIPHIVRRLGGYDQRIVLPCSFLLGGSVLTLCDTIARTVVAPAEMPVGIVTAILGCPVFIWILFRAAAGDRVAGAE